ncbi:MAG: hypothetical protein FWE84_00095 [Firmicutes bacterium]|nr:hypothetical protein [Bacillota bacterium]
MKNTKHKKLTNCNNQTPDQRAEKPPIAAEFAMDDGVTQNAPYKNIARQTMVEYYSDDDENEKSLQNWQGS